MPPESNAKGDRRERELVNRLDELGFAVMRAPASGSATSRELPDVLAGLDGEFYAIEAKSSGGDPIYLESKEVFDLVYFAKNFGAKARIGVRFDREDWFFFHPHDEQVWQTEGGNYRIDKKTALNHGDPMDDLLKAATKEAGEDDEEKKEKILRTIKRGHLSIEDAIEML